MPPRLARRGTCMLDEDSGSTRHAWLVADLCMCACASEFDSVFLSEVHFFKKSLKRCRSLDEAIEWMMELDELKVNIS